MDFEENKPDEDNDNKYDLQVSTIVKNVLNKCKQECERVSLEVPLDDYEGRAAHYTGLPRTVMQSLLQKEANYETDSDPFDVFEHMLILKTLLKCYKSPILEFPIFSKVYDMVKEVIKIKDAAHFRYKLTKMGFDYRKTTTGYILAEDIKQRFQRYQYLKKIKKYKNDKVLIYYIDERLIDKTLTFEKPNFEKITNDQDATHLLDGFYLYHVLSNKGLENYLFTNKKCKNTYIKWVFDILLKVLVPGSVIVIDSHPLHGQLKDETITPYHSKSDMLKWLKMKNMPCSDHMHKAELYELIRKCVTHNIDFVFDKYLKAHGFDVLRLPFGCQSLSPAFLFWKELAKAPSEITIDDFAPVELEETFIPTLTSFHEKNWKKLIDRIKYWEEQFMDIDTQTDEILDKICTFDVHSNKIHNF